jgi:hypothetical protein
MVEYSYRILVDKDFVLWLIDKHKIMFVKLTHIKSSSSQCRGEHNVMLETSLQEILATGVIKEENLRAAFKGKDMPKEISAVHTDITDQMVVWSIALHQSDNT